MKPEACLYSFAVLSAWKATVVAFSPTPLGGPRTAPFASRSTTRNVGSPPSRRQHQALAAVTTSAISAAEARLTTAHLQTLAEDKFVVIPNFLPPALTQELRADIAKLRAAEKFKMAKIGQDSTNSLNQQIRVAETCFLGSGRYADVPSPAREDLYAIMDRARQDLATSMPQPLDQALTELLYAYYPRGGFYRRHRDALPGSASVLREISLLLYLNEEWTEADGGLLRMHMDGGGDELADGVEPNYVDVLPQGGTLVLFESDAIPHEVLDTQKERMAVVGWYNRPMGLADVAEVSGSGAGGINPVQIGMLGVAAALVTVGVTQLLSQ